MGGLLLALGAATPLAAAMIVGVMLVAIVSVDLEKGFLVSNGGHEYPLVLAVASLSLVLTGPGRISLDALLDWEYAGIGWGLASLVVGSTAAALQLAARHRAIVAQAG